MRMHLCKMALGIPGMAEVHHLQTLVVRQLTWWKYGGWLRAGLPVDVRYVAKTQRQVSVHSKLYYPGVTRS